MGETGPLRRGVGDVRRRPHFSRRHENRTRPGHTARECGRAGRCGRQLARLGLGAPGHRFGLEAGAWNLDAGEYEGRNLDWYRFNATSSSRRPRATTGRARVVPTTLYVERMPHPRWWRFEEAGLASIDPGTDSEPNVLSMLLNEYLYLDANNWFLVPLEHPWDTCAVYAARGRRTPSESRRTSRRSARERAVTTGGSFGSTDSDPWRKPASSSFLPNVGGSVVEGDLLEEVRLGHRDREADLVWGVEESYLDPSTGERVTRADETRPPAPAPITPVPDLVGAPRYRLATPLAQTGFHTCLTCSARAPRHQRADRAPARPYDPLATGAQRQYPAACSPNRGVSTRKRSRAWGYGCSGGGVGPWTAKARCGSGSGGGRIQDCERRARGSSSINSRSQMWWRVERLNATLAGRLATARDRG